MLAYGIYARKSHDDRKVTEKSIGEQVAECRRIAEENGLHVARVWEESRTARLPHNRPKWAEMVKEIRAGRIQAILCWNINRLARNMVDGGELVQLMVDGKLRQIRTPHSLHGENDTILPLVLEAASATQYSIDLRRVVNRAMEAKFREGGWNCLAPQGYRNLRDPGNAKIGIVGRDPDRFDLIRKAWDAMLTGNATVLEVADRLNHEWGYRTRATEKHPSGPLSPTGMYQVFRNPFYAGLVKRRGELVRGSHEAMVTPQEFERVQEVLQRKNFRARKSHRHALTGVFRCGHCGQQITAERKRLRNGTLWDFYRCSDSFGRCTKRGISLAKVESFLAGFFEGVSLDPATAEIAFGQIKIGMEAAVAETEGMAKRQEAAKTECRSRLNKLADMWLQGLISDQQRYKELEARELHAMNQLTLVIEKVRGELGHMRENAERAKHYCSFSRQRFYEYEGDHRRALVKALGAEFLFFGREKQIRVATNPLLQEFVTYARAVTNSFESTEFIYGSQKEAPREEALLSGRVERKRVEPSLLGNDFLDVPDLPPALLEALKGPPFPDLDLDGNLSDEGDEPVPQLEE